MVVCHFCLFFRIAFPFQLISLEFFTLSDLLDKPWSQVSSLPVWVVELLAFFFFSKPVFFG